MSLLPHQDFWFWPTQTELLPNPVPKSKPRTSQSRHSLVVVNKILSQRTTKKIFPNNQEAQKGSLERENVSLDATV